MEFSENNVIACFQPILCAALNQIYSYKVLGRYTEDVCFLSFKNAVTDCSSAARSSI